MNNLFARKMEDKSDAELKEIIENRGDYQDEAFSAALYEVEKRRKARVYESTLENDIDEKNKDQEAEEDYNLHRSFSEIMSGLLPGSGYIITPIIIYINILVFFVMVLSGVHPLEPGVEDLINWGGNLRSVTLMGEAWRLLSSAFLHIGVMHLLFNMYALLFIGKEIETQTGSSKFLFAYLMTAVLASIASIVSNENIVSAGASGAIFGMYGVLIALLLLKGIEIPKKIRGNFITSVFIFVGYNLFSGFTEEGIDNAAHIGGLVSGLIIGSIFFVTRNNLRLTRITNFLVALAITLLTISLPAIVPNQMGTYNKMMNEFTILEETALSINNLPENASDEMVLKAVTIDGIPNWKKCLAIVNQLDTISNLPEEYYEQNRLLKLYCDYRIASFKLLERSIRQQTSAYDLSIAEYTDKINLLVERIHGADVPDSALVVNIPEEELQLSESIINSKGPLYVVDGVPVESVNHIDPLSIDQLNVLKDEAATALYGDRGKNGVVLITTKKVKYPRHTASGNTYINDSTKVLRAYHKNGQIESETYYVNGRLHGTYKEWYKNGQLKSEIKYINGKREGITTDYYSNGQKKDEMLYRNNSFIRYNRKWDEYGNTLAIED
ncbi:rhomboid family intramembrane serine protease [Carboxylicivirga sp. RSCT41]|uniref:rhomboid family intramembrane serine protease n=1 Tax=Carboxylicivirga agarovorans TaxID=3417570 RepID=UPI003D326587